MSYAIAAFFGSPDAGLGKVNPVIVNPVSQSAAGQPVKRFDHSRCGGAVALDADLRGAEGAWDWAVGFRKAVYFIERLAV